MVFKGSRFQKLFLYDFMKLGWSILFFYVSLTSLNSFAERDEKCAKPQATEHFVQGFDFQANNNSEKAMDQFQKCLKLEPNCIACLYEQGCGW
ncbi:MAG: hypothetical protein ACK5P5_14140 [Pseudobdellovibrionaceae bacterium]